jgi:hypothetical protein
MRRKDGNKNLKKNIKSFVKLDIDNDNVDIVSINYEENL